MNEKRITEVLKKKEALSGDSYIEKGYKNGIEIEKGATLNEEYLTRHFKEIGNMMSIFSAYPDIYLDLITP